MPGKTPTYGTYYERREIMERESFFPMSRFVSKEPVSLIPKCGACGLYKRCQTPKMKVSGGGKKKILIVGEAPGSEEDRKGIQFVGKTGQHLRDTLRSFNIDMRVDCHITNTLICRPPRNETPTDAQIDYCLPNLRKTIEELKPVLIIPLGSVAVKAVLSLAWKDAPGGITEWAGWRIPCQKWNAWICPTYHPSFVTRSDDERNPIPSLFFERHLERGSRLTRRPWKTLPNYQDSVERFYEPPGAARVIRQMISKRGILAFDFETDRLKPDHPDARIVSCSICWNGKKTIAYPFRGEAVNATREMILSPLPKIGAINKFENRWCMKILKARVRNFYWDCCVGQHMADNRRGITSVKFQAFARLGFSAYNAHIEPFLESVEDGSNSPNRIDEIDLHELLTYNAIDSLVEYKIAMLQMREIGYPLPNLKGTKHG